MIYEKTEHDARIDVIAATLANATYKYGNCPDGVYEYEQVRATEKGENI